MPSDKKRKRSRSRSKDRYKEKIEDRFQKTENVMHDLTSKMTRWFDSNSPLTQLPSQSSVEPNLLTNKENLENVLIEDNVNINEELNLDSQVPFEMPKINDSMLELLGQDPNASKEINVNFNPQLAVRWNKWIKEGYPEEERKNILDIYPRKGELFLEAPKINTEILPVMTEISTKRDQHFVESQNCVGSAISALGAAISLVLEDFEEGVDHEKMMKFLCDAGKLMTHVFYQQSVARKSFITPLMNKSVKRTIDASVTDEWLYGKKFAEQVKEAKDVEKACEKIKVQNKTVISKRDQGNLRNPPVRYRQVGNYQRKFMKFRPRNQNRTNYNTSNTTKTANRTTNQPSKK